MSHSFDCVIDTREMAKTLNSVKHHVDGTTGAVVAMQSAVIKAEKKGAELVCNRVNQGFYAMVHSQISQKMARLQSRVDAQLLRMAQQKKQLVAIRRVMERDYQMISQRYLKTFTTLNRELRQRVTELDRPIIKFALSEADKLTNRNEQTVSVVPVGQNETVKTANRMLASRLKHSAAKAISAIEKFVASANALNAITDRILLHRNSPVEARRLAVPAILLESNFDASDNKQTYVYVSALTDDASAARNLIEQKLYQTSREDALQWVEQEQKPAELTNSFRAMVAESDLPERTKDAINAMYESSTFRTLK